jgi:L-rhamnose isomerase / sugar isomerase
MPVQNAGYAYLVEELGARGIDVEAAKTALKAQQIETPSWGYANGGTRFKVFTAPGAARNIYEKLADAGFIHKLTGIAPSVALHIPWDKVADYGALAQYARAQGVQLGAINPNLFQEDNYKFGSITNADPAIRRQAVEHMLECIDIMRISGSRDLSIWLADGTNYAGQDSFRARKRRMTEALCETYQALPTGMRMLVEYKFFEPGFYSTDIPDWGLSATLCRQLGPQASVLVDTGHHAQGTNVEHIVAILLDEALLGGFHFNARKYADDDLIVGSSNPFELFLIYNELVSASVDADPKIAGCAANVAYMIDQSHNIEPKLEAMLVSVLNCQMALAKALIVDRKTLAERQVAGDVLGAHRVLVDAFNTDVRPLLAQVRTEMNVPADPIAAYYASPYPAKVAAERGTASGEGGGYQGA